MTCKRLSLAPVLFALSASLSAATITVQWDSPPFDPAGTNVGTIYYPVNHSVNAGAGRFEGTVTGSSGFDTSLLYEDESDFYAYCFDLAQTLQSGATYTVAPLASAVVVPGADAAVLDFLGAVNAHFGGDAYRWLKPVNSTESAAIQLGIWEALYNDDFVLTTGGVHFGNVPVAVASLFNTISAARATSTD
ncbi:MAG: hypothetical protein IT493_00980, partial [Gammaproteobacteria bacterium]|nr:hypothetical protein [Gammaproteobacteria bacterium]